MSTSRLEAFSDGVIAIAITLLVLEIHVPAPGAPGTLATKLGHEWPSYAAYVVSFLTIGVIWINHHAMVRRLRSVDHMTLVLNVVLLLWIAALPYSTALLASYLRESEGEHLAAGLYAASFLAMSISFYAIQRHILFTNSRLLHESLSHADRVAIQRRNRAGLIPYAVATAAAAISSYLTLGICALIAVFYALPSTTADPTADAETPAG
jgi:uncharacterized membrane protein